MKKCNCRRKKGRRRKLSLRNREVWRFRRRKVVGKTGPSLENSFHHNIISTSSLLKVDSNMKYFQKSLLRQQTKICQNKQIRFQNDNCERAKKRSAVSYDTLILVYQQLFDMSRIFHSNTLETHVRNYKNFLSSASQFLEEANSCEYNPQWNAMIIKVSKDWSHSTVKRLYYLAETERVQKELHREPLPQTRD